MDQTKKLKTISDARINRLDRDIAFFTDALDALAERWRREIVNLLTGVHSPGAAAHLQDLLYLQGQMQGQLNRLGYDDLVLKFIGKYDDSQQQALETLQAMGVQSHRIAPLNQDALRTLRQVDYAALTKAGTDAVQAISRQVVLNVIGGVSKAEIIDNLTATLDGKFKAYASTYADTALVVYDRTVSWEAWQNAGVERFLYRGPKDIKNRPFCQARVGKTFTKTEIDQMNNGTRLMPVWQYGGGYNCRHVFTPAVLGQPTRAEDRASVAAPPPGNLPPLPAAARPEIRIQAQ